MIPRENIWKNETIKFKGTYQTWDSILSHILSVFPLSIESSFNLYQDMTAIKEENLIFPLDFVKSSILPNDKKGCRIYDWKILTTPQVKNAMKMHGNHQFIRVAHVPITDFFAHVIDETTTPYMGEVEEYNKFLNVTYLVNDKFLQDWINPCYEEKNIANKNVKDCSVIELLFAIKRKLK